jgi:hypothetical protein
MRARSWLPALRLPGLRAAVQRADWHGAEPGPGPSRHRVPGRLLAAARQAEPARPCRDVSDPGPRVHPRSVRDWEARLAPLLVEASPWGSGQLRPGHRFCRQSPPLPAPDIRALFIDPHALNRIRHRMVRQDHRSDLSQRDRQGQHLGRRQGMDQHSGLQANCRGREAPGCRALSPRSRAVHRHRGQSARPLGRGCNPSR